VVALGLRAALEALFQKSADHQENVMKCYSLRASLALATFAVFGLAAHASAAEQVPFKGKLEAVVTVTPVVPPLIVDVLVEGAGSATQLGQFALTIPHRVDRSTRTAIGSYHFIAANGDTLSADFTGVSMPSTTPGVIAIVETATITGGTGRFAGATGGFTCERLYDAVLGTTTGSFNGTISPPVAGSP
jgi:hypothetical protein